jgi:hypothetical protein
MRRITGVAWRFSLAYALFLALWVAGLERRYDDGLALAARTVLARIEEPRLTVAVRRHGALLVVEHAPHFAAVAPQEIVMRRVHSNAPLFVALTLATPASALARSLWLVAGGTLLAASHLAHVVAYVHHHYALYNVGQYFTPVPPAEQQRLGWGDLWARPGAWRRQTALVLANVFNIVLQRVVPIVLWLPLFLRSWRQRDAAAPRQRDVSAFGARARVAAVVVTLVAGVAITCMLRPRPPADVEGIRLGSGALAAKLALEARGYQWTASVRPQRDVGRVPIAFIDLWPRRGPFTEARWGSRFNWIGLRVAQPEGAPPELATACVAGIATAPSDARRERWRIAPDDPAAVCARYWTSGAGPR